jgi:hypothetical protein
MSSILFLSTACLGVNRYTVGMAKEEKYHKKEQKKPKKVVVK